jgi:hypothetical protein
MSEEKNRRGNNVNASFSSPLRGKSVHSPSKGMSASGNRAQRNVTFSTPDKRSEMRESRFSAEKSQMRESQSPFRESQSQMR